MKQIENIATAIEHSRLLREKFLSDPYRPGYHFVIPEDIGVPGDPNGAFYANGRYHLMYLYACRSDGFRWGHMSSTDLIHWRRHPDALIPDELDGGIFSGGAFVDDDGTVYLSYWGLPVEGKAGSCGGLRIAKSSDVKNHYEKWEKFSDYAVACTHSGYTKGVDENGKPFLRGCSDPSNIWKKDGWYYMQAGQLTVLNEFRDKIGQPDAPVDMLGDWVELYRSRNLLDWEFVHRFYQRDRSNRWTDETEDDMCPSFLPLPKGKEGGEPSGKFLQLFIAHNRGAQYYIGSYDQQKDLFYPESHGRMSWNYSAYFAPEALMAPDGRQIMWAWFNDSMENEEQRGWSGVYGLPRSLWLREDGTLGMAPIQELQRLRYNPRNGIDGVEQTSCEIQIKARVGNSGRVGMRLYISENGENYAEAYYQAQAGQLIFDTSRAGSLYRAEPYKKPAPGLAQQQPPEEAPFALQTGETLTLTIFIDKSVTEVYANDRQAVARRVAPENPNNTGLSLICEGDAEILEVKSWDMMPSNPY